VVTQGQWPGQQEKNPPQQVATQQQRHLHCQQQQNKNKLYLHTVYIQGFVTFERIVLWKEPFLILYTFSTHKSVLIF
jgi:hypothetical protein